MSELSEQQKEIIRMIQTENFNFTFEFFMRNNLIDKNVSLNAIAETREKFITEIMGMTNADELSSVMINTGSKLKTEN